MLRGSNEIIIYTIGKCGNPSNDVVKKGGETSRILRARSQIIQRCVRRVSRRRATGKLVASWSKPIANARLILNPNDNSRPRLFEQRRENFLPIDLSAFILPRPLSCRDRTGARLFIISSTLSRCNISSGASDRPPMFANIFVALILRGGEPLQPRRAIITCYFDLYSHRDILPSFICHSNVARVRASRVLTRRRGTPPRVNCGMCYINYRCKARFFLLV